MYRFPKAKLVLALLAVTSCSLQLQAAIHPPASHSSGAQTVVSGWSSKHAQHVYGLPGARPNEAGTLAIDGSNLVFAGKNSRSTIQLQSVLAVAAGNERVELWGMKGRLLRMAIPNGGGLFAATFMHHRVDMFTVEYAGQDGGYHAVVFFLPGKEAERALQAMADAPVTHLGPSANLCHGYPVKLGTVRVPLPAWRDANVPAAYRALVYEHLIDRLRQSAEIDRVYRDGEVDPQGGCPQYTLQLSASQFKEGNQVVRSSTGPVGFFVSTTQMQFDVSITNGKGSEMFHDKIKATVRGESESIKVSESVAKKIAKEFVAAQTQLQRQPSNRE